MLPLPEKYKVTLQIKGKTYTVYDYETLNVDHFACPVCFCSDRERLFALYLSSVCSAGTRKLSLIHFAPEKALSRYLKRINRFAYRTADLYMKNVQDSMDITDLYAYAADSIDCFVCSHVLEHVIEDKKGLKELFRVLKPGGWGILMVPILAGYSGAYENLAITNPQERLRHFGQEDHLRVYGKDGFIARVQNAGFEVHEYGSADFGKEVFSRAAIMENSILYIVKKAAPLDCQ